MDASDSPANSASDISAPLKATVDETVQAVHAVVDRLADSVTAQVDRLSGSAHRALNSAADAVNAAAEWGSDFPEQANQIQTRVTKAACASIRARPLSTVVAALAVGYVMGRMGWL